MARGLYTVSFAATAATVAVDWIHLSGPTFGQMWLWGVFIGQTTELGDSAEEQINYAITRGVGDVTGGGGGSSATPATVSQTDAASTFTANVMNTTQMSAGSGTLTILHRGSFNLRSGLQLWFPPENRPMAESGTFVSRLVIGMVGAPADSVTWVGTAYVEEN